MTTTINLQTLGDADLPTVTFPHPVQCDYQSPIQGDGWKRCPHGARYVVTYGTFAPLDLYRCPDHYQRALKDLKHIGKVQYITQGNDKPKEEQGNGTADIVSRATAGHATTINTASAVGKAQLPAPAPGAATLPTDSDCQTTIFDVLGGGKKK